MVARSLTTTPTEAERAAVRASDWERNREAWNLPHASDGTVARPADHDQPMVGESSAGPDREAPGTPLQKE